MTSLFIDDNSIHPTKGARIKGGGSWFVTKKQSHVRFLKERKISLYWRNVVIYITLTSGGTPPTKNTRSWGSMSNRDSVPGASPFWMNFCSSVELWLGTVRKTFPCLPSLQAKICKLPLWPPPSLNFMNATCLAFSKFANAQEKLTTLTVMCVSRISLVLRRKETTETKNKFSVPCQDQRISNLYSKDFKYSPTICIILWLYHAHLLEWVWSQKVL